MYLYSVKITSGLLIGGCGWRRSRRLAGYPSRQVLHKLLLLRVTSETEVTDLVLELDEQLDEIIVELKQEQTVIERK